ncbi:MAG: hypothetical protein F6J93_04810 [Oscillatoria sp. SIO1A7]|nr:hypothetical protein [Oscillatoria sp. SIO1A7]
MAAPCRFWQEQQYWRSLDLFNLIPNPFNTNWTYALFLYLLLDRGDRGGIAPTDCVSA